MKSPIPNPIGQLRFAPHECDHHVDVVVVGTLDELNDLYSHWCRGEEEAMDDPIEGCFLFEDKSPNYGVLAFSREKLTFGIITHEVVHAAMVWVSVVSMPATNHMDVKDQHAYYDEAVPRVAEHLADQLYPLIKHEL